MTPALKPAIVSTSDGDRPWLSCMDLDNEGRKQARGMMSSVDDQAGSGGIRKVRVVLHGVGNNSREWAGSVGHARDEAAEGFR
jgi:hypothetical protein